MVLTDDEKAQIAGRRCFCGLWPCETHTDEERIAHVIRVREETEPYPPPRRTE
jgi:hypothetical protein